MTPSIHPGLIRVSATFPILQLVKFSLAPKHNLPLTLPDCFNRSILSSIILNYDYIYPLKRVSNLVKRKNDKKKKIDIRELDYMILLLCKEQKYRY